MPPSPVDSRRRRRASLPISIGAALSCAAVCFHLVRLPTPRSEPLLWTGTWLVGCLVFAVALAVAFRGPRPSPRTMAIVVLLGTIACQAAAFRSAPATSTDAWHYVWDGRVQLSGVSPYRYVPGDDALAHLRDPILFPGLGPDEASGIDTKWPLPQSEVFARAKNQPWTVLSRPGVPTIYPPVAQAWFALIAAVTPWSAGAIGVNLGAGLLAVVVAGLLVWLLIGLGRNPTWAALWGWSPTVAVETSANGHVDVLAGLFVLGACAVAGLSAHRAIPSPASRGRAAARWRPRREVGVGVLLALAVLVKIFPVVLLPAFISARPRERPWRATLTVLAAAAITIALAYLPHAVAAGSRVLGYLPGYFVDQGYAEGGTGIRRFGVLTTLGVPEPLLYPVAALVVAVTALAVWRYSDPDSPWDCAVWLLGTAFLLATPSYPWYMLVLVPLIVLSARWEWVAVPIAAGAGYVAYPHLELGRIIWTVAALAIVAVGLWRWRTARLVASPG